MSEAADHGLTDSPVAPEVSVLIVAYRSDAFIFDCIASVEAETRVPHEILLIDNSDDGTAARVAERFPQVRILPSEGNIGFGAGNNRLAAAARAPRLLVLNPDTIVRDAAIDRLAAFARAHAEAGAWGGLTVGHDGRADTGTRLVVPTLGRLARRLLGHTKAFEEGGLRDWTKPGQVEVLCGGFMMVRADIWRALGGFDEGFFLYSEEIDLCLRIRRAGYAIWMTPDARVFHDVGSGDALSPARTFYKTVGQMHFVNKHEARPAAALGAFLVWTHAFQRWAGGALLGILPGRRGERMRRLRAAYGPIALAPGRWRHGYHHPDGQPVRFG